MKTLEELKAHIAELAKQYKELRQAPIRKINQSPTATNFTPEEAKSFISQLNAFDAIKDLVAAANDAAQQKLIADLKVAIPAFIAKFTSSPESQQKQLASVKGRAEAINFLMLSSLTTKSLTSIEVNFVSVK